MKLAAALALAVLGTNAFAEAAKPTPAPRADMVCVTEPSIGSHIKRRSCMTKAQHEARREADRKAADRLKQSKASSGSRPD